MNRNEKIRKRLNEARLLRQQGRGPEAFTAYEDVVAMLQPVNKPQRKNRHNKNSKGSNDDPSQK